MNNYGFKIRKLVLKGQNKKDAILTFTSGLNAITGASDTGKSFAFACIDFIMGSGEVPELPVEAEGYEEVLLEIERYDNKEIQTVQRNLIDNKARLFNSSIDNVKRSKSRSISVKHNPNNSISSYFLDLCKSDYETLLSSIKNGNTRGFSFRDFVHLTMANETKIVWKASPIFTSESKKTITRTGETAAFYTIINGKDYPNTKLSEKKEITKAKSTGKVELLEDLISRIQEEILEDEKLINNKVEEEVENKILKILSGIETKKKNIIAYEEEQAVTRDELIGIANEKNLLIELKNKFSLLKKNYESDLERMEFIAESQFYLSQLVDVVCPICDSKWEESSEELKTNFYEYEEAINSEKMKVTRQLEDLVATMNDLNGKITQFNLSEKSLENKMKQNEILIENELKPIIAGSLNELEGLYSEKEIFFRLNMNNKRIKKYEREIEILNSNLKNNTNQNLGNLGEASEEAINELCKIISSLLKDWNFTDESIDYNKEIKDIVVSGKQKSTFGKGSRAILNSAFIIAIMLYCIKKRLPHPKVVILDSPLTTYKEKDKKAGMPNEEVTSQVKESFFKTLSKLGDGIQLIVFDNVEPSADLHEKINYYHFSGNEKVGRKGFIPE